MAGNNGADESLEVEPLESLGSYTLLERIGVGGMAEVYLAEQEGLAGFTKTVVVKRILPHLAEDPHFVEMFLREGRLAARLSHPHIVQILELSEEGGNYFIAMEYLAGMTLHRLAATAWRNQQSLPTELVCTAVAEAALGLHFAHTRPEGSVIHRDITPENLMINREGITKILDFGIAKPLDDKAASMTEAGELKGKLGFLSPEQVTGEKLDARTDVFSLGVTLYWLLTGVAPAAGRSDFEIMDAVVSKKPTSLRAINNSVPRQLDELTLKMLAKRPEDRVSSADEVHDELEFALQARRKIVVPFIDQMMALPHEDDHAPTELGDLRASVPRTELMASWGVADFTESVPLARAPGIEDAVTEDEAKLPAFVAAGLKSEEGAVFARPAPTVKMRLPRDADESVPTPGSGEGMGLDDTVTAAIPALQMARTSPGREATAENTAPAAPARKPTGTERTVVGPGAGFTSPARTLAVPTARGRVAAAALVLAALGAVGIAVVVALRNPPVQAPSMQDAGAIALASPDAGERAASADAGAAAVVDVVDAGAADVEKPIAPSEGQVEARGPAHIKWFLKGALLGRGPGMLAVPPGTRAVVATDPKRFGRTVVAVAAGVADYGAQPHGTIAIDAKPACEVKLGEEPLGKTPVASVDVVAGTYTLIFAGADREVRKSVDVKAGETAKVLVDFAAVPPVSATP